MDGKVITENRGSISTYGKYRVFYPFNKTVKPTLKGSKLFFFRKYEHAIYFLNSISLEGSLIKKCIATNPTRKNIIVESNETKMIELFWSKDISRNFMSASPIGTRVSDSIRCLE